MSNLLTALFCVPVVGGGEVRGCFVFRFLALDFLFALGGRGVLGFASFNGLRRFLLTRRRRLSKMDLLPQCDESKFTMAASPSCVGKKDSTVPISV